MNNNLKNTTDTTNKDNTTQIKTNSIDNEFMKINYTKERTKIFNKNDDKQKIEVRL